MKYFVTCGERTLEVEVIERSGELHVSVDGTPMELNYSEVDRLGQVVVTRGDNGYGMSVEGNAQEAWVTLAGHEYALQIEDERERAAQLAARAAGAGGGPVKAVMPGVVAEILVADGEAVAQGQPLLVLEAMKMQNEIGAPGDGVVERLHVAAGQAVSAGDVLVTLKGAEEG